MRTEHSFLRLFLSFYISSTICIFLDLLIALILTSGALDISYLDTGIGTELSVSVSNSSFMSANSHTTPAHDPKLSHLVRVIVKKEDKFLCIFSLRNVAHIDCSGLEFPGGKVDIGEGLDGVRVNRQTVCKTAGRELFEETGLRATCLQVLSLNQIHPVAVSDGRVFCSVVFVHSVFDDGTNTALLPLRKEPSKQRYVKFLSEQELLSEPSSFNGHWDCLFTDFVIKEKVERLHPSVRYPLPSTVTINSRNLITSLNSRRPTSVTYDYPSLFHFSPEIFSSQQ